MYLENLVFDAVEPQRLGRFWEAALGCERLTDEPDIYETRLTIEGGPVLDLCFQRVASPPSEPVRLHLDLAAGTEQAHEVERLLGAGARHIDISQQDVLCVALADPEGNPFCVTASQHAGAGPLSALALDSADPDRDLVFWARLTGWGDTGGRALRHPSLRGPLLQFRPEPAPKPGVKNRLHLDVRLDAGESPDAVAAGIVERGGRELHHGWGELPWRIYADPSGNEFCVLPAPA